MRFRNTENSTSVEPRYGTFAEKRFLKQGFTAMREIFEQNLKQVEEEVPRLEVDFTPTAAFDFSAEIFVDGKSKCRCRVWLANHIGSDSIGFQEGNATGNSFNEILYPSTDGEPAFSASMAMGMTEVERSFGMKGLNAEDAAAYLWARFVKPLSY